VSEKREEKPGEKSCWKGSVSRGREQGAGDGERQERKIEIFEEDHN
jgi:hypothetical protein